MINRLPRAVAALCCGVALFACGFATGCGRTDANSSSGSSSQPSAAAAARDAKPVEVPFPLPVIELAGSDEKIGAEHGRRLGDTIRSLHANYLNAYFKSPGQRLLAMAAAAAFEPRVAPEHLAEVRALAKETGIEPRQMLLAQCFLDLSAMTACSTVTLPADASPDGVARFGRNLDFPSFDIADKATVVLVYKPEGGRYAFAAVGWPGMCGVLSGMNEHGLTLANMEVTRTRRLPTAMPYVLLYRTLLERCKTVDEAIALLAKTPRQSANNLMLMDAAGNRAVAEITPEGVAVRRGVAGEALFSTNHQRGDDTQTPGLCPRYDSLHDASAKQFGKIDVRAIETMLAAASQKKLTLQSMVFEPSNRVIYLSAGADAARKTFYKLDLTPKFAATVSTASNSLSPAGGEGGDVRVELRSYAD